MATVVRPTQRQEESIGIKYVTRQEGIEILDRQARKYLGMSGDEFVRRYRAGEIEDPGSTDVMRVAMLIPLTDP